MAKHDIEKLRKDGWIDAWFAIEAMALDTGTVESALCNHVEKLSKVDAVAVYETDYKKTELMKVQPNNVPSERHAYSQVVNIKLLVKNLYDLVNVIMVYGPSAVEILGPKEKKIELGEIQSIANVIGGLMHEFASQGVGGMMISAPQKRQ